MNRKNWFFNDRLRHLGVTSIKQLSTEAKASFEYYAKEHEERKAINPFVEQLSQNNLGDDYIVGDLHGRYSELMQQLKDIDFDFQKDRLIAVGDLGDRGDESDKVIQLLEEPWFRSVRGNHDQFILDQFEEERVLLYGGYKRVEPTILHRRIEGAWFFQLDEQCRAYLAKLLMPLPYIIELYIHGYKIGINHAGIPTRYGNSWNDVVNDIYKRDTRELCLRTRRHAEMHQEGIERVIEDIDYTIHGHTCFEKPLFTLFSAFIDTFDKSGQLTILKVSDLVRRLDANKESREARRLKRQDDS